MQLSRSWVIQNFVYLPVIVSLAAGGIILYWHSNLPIHELFETEITPSVVYLDSEGKLCVSLSVVSIRSERCGITLIRRSFARVSDNRIVLELMTSGGAMPSDGKKRKGPPVPICLPPEQFPDGEYIVTTRADNRCSDGRLVTAISDFGRFRVERNPK